MTEIIKKTNIKKIQLIKFEEKDSLKEFFSQNKVRGFFEPYFKDKHEFQKVVQDVSTAYHKDKLLQKCDKKQILLNVIDCLNLGLTIDKREHAYLVPRPKFKYIDGKKTDIIIGYTSTLQIGWRGYIYKITQQYPDFNIDKICFVRKEDEFKVENYNESTQITHLPSDPFDNSINNVRGIYCILSFTKEKRLCKAVEFMSLGELNKIKSKATMGAIWRDWFEEQSKKTVLRRACKRIFPSITKKLDDFDNQFYNLNTKEPKTKGLEELNGKNNE